MIRNTINIAGHPYIFELYKHGVDKEAYKTNKYVLLRRFEMFNTVDVDKCIYVVDKKKLNDYFDGMYDMVFPDSYKEFISFSDSPSKFSSEFTDIAFNKDTIGINSLIYKKSDTGYEEANVPCDIVRIYHPHTTGFNDAIIHIDNYIDSIKFHWLCRKTDDYDSIGAVPSFSVDNFIYNEYIEFLLPCPETLISNDFYYRDRTAVVTTRSYETIKTIEGDYIPLELLKYPYAVKETTITIGGTKKEVMTKEYDITIGHNIKMNFIAHPEKVTYVPYTGIDDVSRMYVCDDNRNIGSDIFVYDTRFEMSSNIGFDDAGNISLLNIFNYPRKEEFNSFSDAYTYYYNVKLSDYEGIIDDEDDDYDEENPVDQKQIAITLHVYYDFGQKTEIGRMHILIDDLSNNLDDFAFDLSELTKIVPDWNSFMPTLTLRAEFYDRYLGVSIKGNPVYVTKEHFKYILHKGDNIVQSSSKPNKIESKEDMDLSKINFLDNIQCNIIKTEDAETSKSQQVSSEPRMLYKPIFFRAYDLQAIEVKREFKQNIGIALGDYMTKVEAFKIVINGITYVESSRNEVFVIFKVNGPEIAASIGDYTPTTYSITDQDDNYISSGKFTLA